MRGKSTLTTSVGIALLSLALAVGCGGVDAGEAVDSGFVELGPPPTEQPVAQDGFVSPAVEPGANEPSASAAIPSPRTAAAVPPDPGPAAATEQASAPAMPAAGDAPAPPKMALEAQGKAYLAAGEFARAARVFSDLMLEEVRGSTPADQQALDRWREALDRAQANHRWSARGDWESTNVQVHHGDSLIAIRKRVLAEHPDLLLCTGLIARANQLRSPTAIRADDELRIPLDRPSVLVDLSARWAFYLLGGEVAAAWRVGVGKEGSPTAPGRYTIGNKQEDPPWFPEGRPMVPYGDPRNPLGTRWMSWDDENGRPSSLGFHGTNDPSGVGGQVSEGCIRMHNEDVELLFEILPVGAEVVVQP